MNRDVITRVVPWEHVEGLRWDGDEPPHFKVVHREDAGNSRWHRYEEVMFEEEDIPGTWRFVYGLAATECQEHEETPTVTLVKVTPVEVAVVKWVPEERP